MKNSIRSRQCVYVVQRFFDIYKANIRYGMVSIDMLLIEPRILVFFVGGCHKSVSLILKPFSDSQFVFCRSQKLWNLFCMLSALQNLVISYIFKV